MLNVFAINCFTYRFIPFMYNTTLWSGNFCSRHFWSGHNHNNDGRSCQSPPKNWLLFWFGVIRLKNDHIYDHWHGLTLHPLLCWLIDHNWNEQLLLPTKSLFQAVTMVYVNQILQGIRHTAILIWLQHMATQYSWCVGDELSRFKYQITNYVLSSLIIT